MRIGNFIFCLSIILGLFSGCLIPPYSDAKPKYTDPFIIEEAKAADELFKKGVTFKGYSVSDGITRDGGGGGYWSAEDISTDGVKVVEEGADYRSPEEAKAQFEKTAEKLKESEIYERVKGQDEGEGDLVIAVRKKDEPTAIIVWSDKKTVHKIHAPTLRYVLAFKNKKQNKQL